MQPPIVPGDPQPYTLSNLMPTPAPRPRRRRWLVPALAAAAVLVVAVAAFLYLGGLDRVRGVVDPAPQRASEACGQVGDIGDGGKTLILKVIGPDRGFGPVSPENLACVLRELDTPAYVVAQIGQTRALDGQLHATWGDLEATWTYHPDNGLNLIIHQR